MKSRHLRVMATTCFAAAPAVGIAVAQPVRTMAPVDLAVSPGVYSGQTIRMTGIPCVDDPDGGFVCIKLTGGRVLMVRAEFLGTTGRDIPLHVIRNCKGTANLDRQECRFVVSFAVPAKSEQHTMPLEDRGTIPLTILKVRELNLHARSR